MNLKLFIRFLAAGLIMIAIGSSVYLYGRSQTKNNLSSESVKGLPPDPGTAGKTTLAGIDSDGDGVRDDIQRYIALTYPDSAKTRAALSQVARALQVALLNANDKQASIAAAGARLNAIRCLGYILTTAVADSTFNELLARILNTKERSTAFILADNQLGGQVFASPSLADRKLLCMFDPDALPN